VGSARGNMNDVPFCNSLRSSVLDFASRRFTIRAGFAIENRSAGNQRCLPFSDDEDVIVVSVALRASTASADREPAGVRFVVPESGATAAGGLRLLRERRQLRGNIFAGKYFSLFAL
jgi:hypothetical protein